MSRQLNGIFNNFNESLLSIAKTRNKNKFESSYLSESLRLDQLSAMDSTSVGLEQYSSDIFIEDLKEQFRKLVGKDGRYKDRETIGTHPDFQHLEGTTDIEKHYIVSMFVDIKNSSSIYLKTEDLVRTKVFKNTVLRIITIFMQIFDGHIHRLQGDAVFGYFGWKDKCEEDAIIDSLNAASFLLMYIEKGLNPELESIGYPPLKIRVGIDFGSSNEVIWSEYGLSPATEVTTTSLHTDLAAKLQNRAPSNTIMIGDNIKEFLDLPDEFLTIKIYKNNNEPVKDEYILNKPEKRYKMWIFKHQHYLKYFPNLDNDNFTMSCLANGKPYYPNSSALEKGMSLEYQVTDPFVRSHRGTSNIKFVWSKENRGKEARGGGGEGKLSANRSNHNKADEGTLYRGHHIMKCKILQGKRVQATLKFGIFIK